MNSDSAASNSNPASDENLLALGKGALRTAGGERPTPWQPPSPEELQSMLPPGYGVIRILGRGGMGAVYLARQLSLDRLVAIKILPDDLDEAGLSFAERFKNEARAMAQLSHPGIVAVFDFGQTTGGLLYIVMEYIEGTDVAQMIANQGRLHSAHAMAIVAHVCDALAYAHARGIIHRDIKPSNIMISNEGVVKVADFGLAKMNQAGQSTGLTQSGMVMGTLHFMAPEALTLGSAVDQRADIYAVGVMLYQMLTGKLPQGLFEMPSLQIPGLDPRYDGIVAKALREDRALRYQNAGEMRHDLDAILTQPVVRAEAKETPAPAATPPAQAAPPPRSQPQRVPGQVYRPPQRSGAALVKKKSSTGIVLAGVAVIAAAIGALVLLRSKGVNTMTSQQVTAEPQPATNIPQQITTNPQRATKNKPFVNSLGMQFVPVPITGGPSHKDPVFFSVWETRVQDYDTFVKATGRMWRTAPFQQGPTHPAVMVSWEDAKAFCAWLSQKERVSGLLPAGEEYRLPSDHEWSCAACIGENEDPSRPPKIKDGALPGYHWGSQWPPPAGTGNYPDENLRRAGADIATNYVHDFNDGFPFTAPVGSFPPNKLGLFDLSGNVWEWVEEWYDEATAARALRGASWHDPWTPQGLRLSDRHGSRAGDFNKDGSFGFRCIRAPVKKPIVVPASATGVPRGTTGSDSTPIASSIVQPRVAKSAAPPVSATKDKPYVNSLGMKFVPVPGTKVLFCIWETRFRDYDLFAKENPPDADRKPPGWKGMVFDQGADYPVGAVRWNSAKAFCEWLTKKERAAGQLPDDATYRLPKEAEWLLAAADELEHPTPNHPPGNFADEAFHRKTPHLAWIRGFDDGFAATAQVGSFAANRLGIHDLLGNVWEWCDEYYDQSVGGNRLLRGGSCAEPGFGRHGTGDVVDGDVGFRVVLELPAASRVMQAVPAPLPKGATTWTDTKGRSITASYKGVTGDKVLLDIAGKVTPVAVNTLSAESQKLVRDYQEQFGSGADASPTASSTQIPAGALSFGRSRYAFFQETLTWTQAKEKAESLGGHLAVISSAAEDEWVVAQFQAKLAPGKTFWIGGIQDKPDQPWKWVTGEKFDVTQWANSEPNNAKSAGPKSTPPYMLAYYLKPGERMGWNDISESDPQWRNFTQGYLVEWEAGDASAGKSTSPPAPGGDRKAAEWVLGVGGKVTVSEGGRKRQVTSIEQLPAERFSVVEVNIGFSNDARPVQPLTEIDALSGLKELALLRLGSLPLRDEHLAVLATLPSLTQLFLTNVGISDDCLPHLAACPKLFNLSITNSARFTGLRLHELSGLRNLRGVVIGTCPLEPDSFRSLGKLKQVTQLGLSQTPVTDADLPHLSGMSGLQQLEVSRTKVTAKGLSALKGLRITTLEWPLSSEKYEEEALELAQSFPHIELVTFGSAKSQPPAALSALRHLPALKGIECRGRMTPELLSALLELPQLKFLRFAGAQVEDDDLAIVARHPSIEEVRIGTVNTTDAGLLKLAALKSLRKIGFDLAGAVKPKISPEGITAFRKLRPDVEVLKGASM